jgi:hypothetical protein
MATALDLKRQRHIAERSLVRHFVEMVLAMVVGMVVLGAAVWGAFGLLGHSNLSHYAEVRAFVMTMNMTIGMALWMRYRRHSSRGIAEMAGAMFVPYVVLIVPFWAELLSAQAFLLLMHALMFPCMIAAMLRRREEYTSGHKS